MIYNYFLEKLVLPAGDILFQSNYIQYLNLVRNESMLNELEINKIQTQRLIEVLDYAKKKSNYYKYLISDEIINDPFSCLKKLPLLTKAIIRDNTSSLLTTDKKKLIKLCSSGSTGEQTEVYLSKKELSLDRAIQTLWWEWAGYKIGKPMLQTGLASKRTIEKRLKDLFFRTKYIFAFGLTESDLIQIENWIKLKKPFLGGYASSLYVISELLANKNIEFDSCVSWGDKLFDHYKNSILEKLNTRVYETYGTGEGFKIAAQKDLNYMYLMSPYNYIEILDDNGNEVEDGDIGNVIVTSLVNKSMPLIRYKIGDLAMKLPNSEYPKDRELALPLLKKVIGRETDLVKTPKGKKLIVHSFTGIFEYYSGIKQFCIIQGNIEGVLIQYIKSNMFTINILDEIKVKLDNLINEKFDIQFQEVDFIPPTNSGKPQIIISRI